MYRLAPRLHHDAWGSHERIARVTGRPVPSAEPESELWYGAHEDSSSALTVDGEPTTLFDLVSADPEGILGPDDAARFGGRFPYLLKLLAPAKAVSIQVHPTLEQALDAPHGTYGDPWPKPEAFLALEPSEVFAGVDPFDQFRTAAEALAVPELTAIVEWAAGQEVPARAFIEAVLTLDIAPRNALVASVLGVLAGRPDPDPKQRAILRISRQFPADIGLVVLLAMTHRVAQPGEYLFIPAGCLHAHVDGLVVELMANSDNVVRAGLTAKEMNLPELFRILDVDAQPVPSSPAPGRVRAFGADSPYFQLYSVEPGREHEPVPRPASPRIAMALDDVVTLRSGDESLPLTSGEGAYLLPGEEVTVAGGGTLYVATTG